MNPTIVKTSGGEEIVLLSKQDYDALVDARDVLAHQKIIEKMADCPEDWLSLEEANALLAAPTPVSFWRERRGRSQSELADAAGISRAYMSQIESGARTGTPDVLARIARALQVSLDDLVIIEERA